MIFGKKIGGKGTSGPPIAKKNGNISKKGHYFVSKYARIVIFIKKMCSIQVLLTI